MQKKKKGFTLVELLVVIAILAILASVSVVGYLSFTKKAQESNDVSLTDQMNTVLQANEALDKADTLGEAIKQIKEDGGVDLELITPNSKGYNYAWDKKQNRILLLNESNEVVAPVNLKDEATEDTVLIVKTKEQLEKAVNANYGVGIASSYTEDITTFDLFKQVSLDNYAGKIKTLNVKSTTPATYSLERNTNSNVYYSGVFENITLDESDGVTIYGEATTLDVKKNTGITIAANINKVVVSEGNVNVVEKAVVDFVDASKASKVTINKTSTAVVGGVQAPEGNKGAVDGNIGSDIVVNTKPVTDFAGGLGTENSPYLIQTIEHFKKINSHKVSYKYYKLIETLTIVDTDTAAQTGIVNTLNGCFDGNDNYINFNYNGQYTSLFKSSMINSIVKDLNVSFSPLANDKLGGAFVLEKPKDSIIFDDVDLYGRMKWNFDGRNQSPYINEVSTSQTTENNVTFNNCNVNMNLEADSYNAVFVGYIAKGSNHKSNFYFNNCSFDGSFIGHSVGILFGNVCNISEINKFEAKNVVNYGELLGFEEAHLAFANKATDYDKYVINKNKCNKLAALDGFTVNVGSDMKLNITKPTDEKNITSYKVVLSQYVSWYEGNINAGSDIIAVEFKANTIQELGDIYAYEFRQSTKLMTEKVKSEAKYTIDNVGEQTQLSGNDKITLINSNGQIYYYLDSNVWRPNETGYVVITNPKPSITIYAMNGDSIVSIIKAK